MPIRAELLPGNPRTVTEDLRRLKRIVEELRASRGLENSALTSGGLTAIGSGGQSLQLTPTSPTGITLPDSSVINPPAVALTSSTTDLAAGILAAYRKPTTIGSVPVVVLLSPQAGPSTAGVTLQGGEESGESALAQLAAGAATLALTPTGLTLTLASGAVLTFTAAGISASGTTAAPEFAEDTTTRTSTATAFADAASGPFSAQVTVPPSGRVIVTIRCTQRATGSLNAFTSFNAVGSSSGTRYTENLTAALAVNGANNFSLSLRHPLSGMTPGETLTVTHKHRLNAAGTQTLDYRSILLEPSTT
ncbi:hypothetical protein P1P75_11930 [Streptomyces sp. ID05-39B]|uniref:hypothetical protein n=1 Tax=Streptomyces sp. ID05-39B TaxID=3028664 RepID=UPI0029B89D60|nr:hypothetical protein [Streptomyces sp. ID05-39B]MDX3527132.1 hypothetical protein [Streptomyces sp. ID05-39B]